MSHAYKPFQDKKKDVKIETMEQCNIHCLPTDSDVLTDLQNM